MFKFRDKYRRDRRCLITKESMLVDDDLPVELVKHIRDSVLGFTNKGTDFDCVGYLGGRVLSDILAVDGEAEFMLFETKAVRVLPTTKLRKYTVLDYSPVELLKNKDLLVGDTYTYEEFDYLISNLKTRYGKNIDKCGDVVKLYIDKGLLTVVYKDYSKFDMVGKLRVLGSGEGMLPLLGKSRYNLGGLSVMGMVDRDCTLDYTFTQIDGTYSKIEVDLSKYSNTLWICPTVPLEISLDKGDYHRFPQNIIESLGIAPKDIKTFSVDSRLLRKPSDYEVLVEFVQELLCNIDSHNYMNHTGIYRLEYEGYETPFFVPETYMEGIDLKY